MAARAIREIPSRPSEVPESGTGFATTLENEYWMSS